ncbi:MAG: ABC transporter permease [Polyangiaceae bacterium]
MTAKPTLFERVASSSPIWVREMRQSARLAKTPWVLLSLTVTVSLVLASAGWMGSQSRARPAVVGSTLFQAFFTIATMVVAIVGPAIAANAVAAEREGRTWEALVLTGMSARDVAVGKFLSAYSTLALYVVTLAPAGALAFLFGGVTATEVVLAFGILFVLAALAVGFGLAMSSLMPSLRGALLTTLLGAAAIAPALGLVFGFGGSRVAHDMFRAVPAQTPIWLPLALTRADFGPLYVVLLVLVPVGLVLVAGRFLYALTIANLDEAGADPASRLTRWFLSATPAVLGLLALPPALARSGRGELTVLSLGALATFGYFGVLLFAREPVAPSRRTRRAWERDGASWLARGLGGGAVSKAALVATTVTLSLVCLAWLGSRAADADHSPETSRMWVALAASYTIPFLGFTAGLMAWLRARGTSTWVARAVSIATVLGAFVGPWLVAALVAAVSGDPARTWMALASPSPFYVATMCDAVSPYAGIDAARIHAGLVAELGWTFAAVGLFARAFVLARQTEGQER